MAAPSLSIVIPVLDETGAVNRILKHLSTLEFPGSLEVIIADGNPAGITLAAVSPDIHAKLSLKTTIAPRGRGAQMNCGAALADGDILLFLHADTIVSQEAADRLHVEMEYNRSVVGGAFDLGIHSSKKYYRLIEYMANRRSRLTRIPYGDQAIFLRKTYFFSIGGFSEIPLMEDVALMRTIKKKRDNIVILPIKVLTSARRWEKEGPVGCTLRNWLLISLYLLGVSPFKLSKYYKF